MPVDSKIFQAFNTLKCLRPQSANSLAQKVEIRRASGASYLQRAGQTVGESLFLLSGQVLLEDAFGKPGLHLVAGDEFSREAMPNSSPARWSIRCLGPVSYLAIDSSLLEVMLDWSTSGSVVVEELRAQPSSESDWMTRLLSKGAFRRLPATNLQALFQRLQRIQISAGTCLIQQGDAGDFFYVIEQGQCEVWHESPRQPDLLLASFGPGECFGEESLLSGAPRSATVRAALASRLFRLSAEDFDQLLARALLQRLSYAEAHEQVEQGRAQWLDVRMPDEQRSAAPPACISLPAHLLRYRLRELDPELAYICACENSRRSAVASFVLNQAGLDAFVLDGGLEALPTETVEP